MIPNFPDPLLDQLRSTGVIAVLVVDDAEDGVSLARALLDGGVRAMELTLRTPAALEALGRIRAAVPEMIAGVGTVLTPDQVRQVHDAGAAFGVAPGMNPRVVAEARKLALPFAPGICTPSEIEAALEQNCWIMKFFPAVPSGGLDYLKSMAAPYVHLGVQFIPLGGLNESNVRRWWASPLIAAIGGSWIAPRRLIQEKHWNEIRGRAEAAVSLAQEVRGENA